MKQAAEAPEISGQRPRLGLCAGLLFREIQRAEAVGASLPARAGGLGSHCDSPVTASLSGVMSLGG
jgi:hypothetical protein